MHNGGEDFSECLVQFVRSVRPLNKIQKKNKKKTKKKKKKKKKKNNKFSINRLKQQNTNKFGGIDHLPKHGFLLRVWRMKMQTYKDTWRSSWSTATYRLLGECSSQVFKVTWPSMCVCVCVCACVCAGHGRLFFDQNRNIRNITFRVVVWLTREESNIDTERNPDLSIIQPLWRYYFIHFCFNRQKKKKKKKKKRKKEKKKKTSLTRVLMLRCG